MILGFRSSKLWKKVVASICYLLIAIFMIANFEGATLRDKIINEVQILIFLVPVYIFILKYKVIRVKLPLLKEEKLSKRVIGIISYSLIFLIIVFISIAELEGLQSPEEKALADARKSKIEQENKAKDLEKESVKKLEEEQQKELEKKEDNNSEIKEEESSQTASTNENTREEKLPEYKIELVDNTNLGSIIRETIHITVKGDYTLDDLYKIAEKEAKDYTANHKVNALAIGFYTDKENIGKGYDMGYVDYVPNGNWGDAVNIKAGDYSSFKFVNHLEEPIVTEKGKDIEAGKSDLKLIKKNFVDVYGNTDVKLSKNGDTLIVHLKEAEDNQFFDADENAIATYTDYCLDNIKSDIEYLDITVVRPSSSAQAVLSMDNMKNDNGRYFETDYIRDNIK